MVGSRVAPATSTHEFPRTHTTARHPQTHAREGDRERGFPSWCRTRLHTQKNTTQYCTPTRRRHSCFFEKKKHELQRGQEESRLSSFLCDRQALSHRHSAVLATWEDQTPAADMEFQEGIYGDEAWYHHNASPDLDHMVGHDGADEWHRFLADKEEKTSGYRMDYSALSVAVMTLGLIMVVEVVLHNLDHAAHGRPYFTAVLENIYSERKDTKKTSEWIQLPCVFRRISLFSSCRCCVLLYEQLPFWDWWSSACF